MTRRLRAVAAATSVLTILAVSACGATGATSSTANDASVTAGEPTTGAPAPSQQPRGGAAHFTDYAADTDGPSSSVIMTGAIGDYGTARYVHQDGTVDPEHTDELMLALAHGTLRLSLATLRTRLLEGFANLPVSPTCSETVTASANAPIVDGSGTGAYAHVSGTFTATATIDEVEKGTACHGTGAFLAQTIVIAGSGHVVVP